MSPKETEACIIMYNLTQNKTSTFLTQFSKYLGRQLQNNGSWQNELLKTPETGYILCTHLGKS